MADFRTHVTFSGCIGAGYAVAVAAGGLTGVQAVLAGCLTGCAGMLPDLDADNGRPLREIFSLTAALVPVLEMDRLRTYAVDSEGTILLAILVYISIRYGASTLLAMLSVHRGMFHSIPAAVIAAELAYLAYPSGSALVKLLMAGGVAIGFLSHLVLDEIYSVQWNGAQVRLKASAGSALKVFGNSMIANATTWGILCSLSWGIANQGQWPTGDVPQPRMAIPAPKPRG